MTSNQLFDGQTNRSSRFGFFLEWTKLYIDFECANFSVRVYIAYSRYRFISYLSRNTVLVSKSMKHATKCKHIVESMLLDLEMTF